MNGLNDFMRSIREAQKVLENLDGDLATVRFDPEDPGSIERAIQEMERVIDERVGPHAGNSFVAPLVEAAKEQFRQSILDKAAAARSGETDDDTNQEDEV